MRAIPIYDSRCVDFSTNGLGLLQPTSCKVEGRGNDMYELTMEIPLSDTSRWEQAVCGRIVKVICPERQRLGGDAQGVVNRLIYKVNVNTNLRLRQDPSTSAKILGSYPKGTEVLRLEPTSGGWMHVAVLSGGTSGYMYATYLTFSRTITTDVSVTEPAMSREQLFRIYSTDVDTDAMTLTVSAQHIFYDLRGNVVDGVLEVKDWAPDTAAQVVWATLMKNTTAPEFTPFTLHCGELSGKVSGEYSYKSPVDILLDSNDGILAQCGGLILRDNFDVYLMPDDEHDAGVTIRRGKNLTGVTVTTDESAIVTRIIPCGKTKDGDPLFLAGTKYVDSIHINDYYEPFAKKIDYDIQVADKGDYTTEDKARAALKEAAEAEFDTGCDLPVYGMEVNFVMLSDEDNADYAALQSVHLYDTVTVIDELIGLRAKIRVTQYVWDALQEQFDSIVLGNITDMTDFRYWGGNTSGAGGNLLIYPPEAMTADSSQGCVASASSCGSSVQHAYNAFDYDTSNEWRSEWPATDAEPYIQLQVDTALTDITITAYSFRTWTTDLICNPAAGRVYGSKNGTTWVQIAEFSGWERWAIGGELIGSVSCLNTVAYSYIRVVFTDRTQADREVAIGYMTISGRKRG